MTVTWVQNILHGDVFARLRQKIGRGLLFVIVAAVSLLFAFPFYWALVSSLKEARELVYFPPTWLPEVPQWQNYVTVILDHPFLTWLLNTLVVVALSSLGTILSACTVAYAFARFEFPGRDIFFMAMLGTMMLPAEVTLIPRYLFFAKVGWVDTFKPLIVPSWFGSAVSIFLLRQFFMTIPRDLDEAAEMDGAGTFRILWNIIVPLSVPVLATVTVINMIGVWNAFMGPLIYLNSPSKFTMSLGLRLFTTMVDIPVYPTDHLVMAFSVLMVLPCVVLFFTTQRYFIRGVVMSGIKG